MVNIPVRWIVKILNLSGFPRRPGGFRGRWEARFNWAYSSVWLERTPDKREVGGSNPPRPTNIFDS